MLAEAEGYAPYFELPAVDDRPAPADCQDVELDCSRETTAVLHYEAVRRTILEMRGCLGEPLTLQSMARMVALSPFHFNRVFCRITGIPPRRFLSALRMQAAKRLLLTTRRSVTDVCFDVGYNSLGTFTTQFTQLVGLPPRRLRHLAEEPRLSSFEALESLDTAGISAARTQPAIEGRISVPAPFEGLIFAGLFTTSIPQGRPACCAVLTEPGAFRLSEVPDGSYYLFVVAFPRSPHNPLSYLLPDTSRLLVGGSHNPLQVSAGRAVGETNIMLRLPRLTDPPILVALPFLLAEHETLGPGHYSSSGCGSDVASY